MITEKEFAEYRFLCATLGELQQRYLEKKQELRRLLEQTVALRRDTLLVLAKANRLTRHLTGRQRQITGLSYRLGEIKARIDQCSPVLFQGPGEGEKEIRTTIRELQSREDCRSRRELKQNGLALLGMIDNIRKNILQLDLLELRCRELLLSINKALEAFRHESRIIRRKIYPFGIFSLFCRTLRGLWGRAYFTPRDLEDVAALGNITGYVLKIADSPLV